MKPTSFFVFLFLSLFGFSQDPAHDWTVQMSAEINTDPATITLKWLPNAVTADTYFIWKKEKETVGWGTSIASVDAGGTLEFVDTYVEVGKSYEYMIQLRTGGTVLAWSYINAGIEVELNPNKGDILLLVDQRHAAALASEIDILEYDMYTDGWMVTTEIIDSTSSPQEVKDIIRMHYESLYNLVGLYILGHVAVPYSGDLYPDYNYPHKGAWPADVYYGDMFGEWTDAEVNITTAADPRNHNVPGDGKFDQSRIPSTINLQLSRVDFYNLPTFGDSEEDLLRTYLNKAHEFKMADYIPADRGLIDQGDLTSSLEGFAQNGLRNFTAFFGPDGVHELDYWTTLNGNDYLWSYGCGNGTFFFVNGLNAGAALTTTNISTGFNESTFTMLYGTNFGDWDTQNNIMRAAIANGRTLSCSWAGRPNWHYQHLALGENIGYAARISQDLFSDYFSLTIGGGTLVTYEGVHVEQLGDPTVRMYYVAPPGEVTAENAGENALVSWTASADTEIDGYNVYRRVEDGLWGKVNDVIITETTFTDTDVPGAGDFIYLVKSVKLKSNGSGSFYNESHGREATTTFVSGVEEESLVQLDVYPNPNDGNLTITANASMESLFIYAADGKKVYSGRPNSTTFAVTLSDLSEGLYILEVTIGGEKHQQQLIMR